MSPSSFTGAYRIRASTFPQGCTRYSTVHPAFGFVGRSYAIVKETLPSASLAGRTAAFFRADSSSSPVWPYIEAIFHWAYRCGIRLPLSLLVGARQKFGTSGAFSISRLPQR